MNTTTKNSAAVNEGKAMRLTVRYKITELGRDEVLILRAPISVSGEEQARQSVVSQASGFFAKLRQDFPSVQINAWDNSGKTY